LFVEMWIVDARASLISAIGLTPVVGLVLLLVELLFACVVF
jgi:hypothetical protein